MEIRLKITYDTEFFIKSADGSHSDDNAKLLKTINAQLKKKSSSFHRTVQTIYLNLFEQPFRDLISDDEQIEPFYVDYKGYLQLVQENDQFNLYIITDVPDYNWNQFVIDAFDIYTEKIELLSSIGDFAIDYNGTILTVEAKTFVKKISLI